MNTSHLTCLYFNQNVLFMFWVTNPKWDTTHQFAGIRLIQWRLRSCQTSPEYNEYKTLLLIHITRNSSHQTFSKQATDPRCKVKIYTIISPVFLSKIGAVTLRRHTPHIICWSKIDPVERKGNIYSDAAFSPHSNFLS